MTRHICRILPFLVVVGLLGCRSSDRPATTTSGSLDPRLGGFLETIFKDPEALAREKNDYATRGVTFEPFIYVIYTGTVRMDTTPDNSMALAQLGEYLEKIRPELAPELLAKMEEFYAVESNHTFMRGMFLTTVKGLTKGQ
jgi:hypothetical protein